MTSPNEAMRLSAHVLLDAASAFDSGLVERGGSSAPSVNLAWQRLNDIPAMKAKLGDDGVSATVDATPLLTAALMVINSLISGYAMANACDRDEIINAVRVAVDASAD